MIRMFDYRRALPELEHDLVESFRRVLHSDALILGPETEAFENEFAAWVGARYCLAVSSGTMALFVALRAVGAGSGDEVISVANTCPPTIAAIRLTGAVPVFVDVDPDTLMMDMTQVESAVTPRTRAVMPVHLWGSAVDLAGLDDIAKRHDLFVIEDCAQAAGTRFQGRQVGTFGSAGCFSFYPSKNLGGYGDGGAVVTNDPDLAATARKLRMYGYVDSPVSTIEGVNARINEVQSALLQVRLQGVDKVNARRRQIAAQYNQALSAVSIPRTPDRVHHAYHQFVVRCRDRAQVTARLDAAEIEWGIHYPTPVHQMPAYRPYSRDLPITEKAAGEILSLPVHEHLTDKEVSQVVTAIES